MEDILDIYEMPYDCRTSHGRKAIPAAGGGQGAGKGKGAEKG